MPDLELNNFYNNIEIDLDELSKLPKKYYTWKHDEYNVGMQIGTSAQELMKMYPELVSTGTDGNLTVDYARLSIVALSAIDKLNEENKKLKTIINEIAKKIGLN